MDTRGHPAERHALGVVVALSLANAGSLAGFAFLAWALGADLALEPGSWRESDVFAAGVVGAALLASGIGGAACRLIARRRTAVALAAILLASWWGFESACKLTTLDACQPRDAGATFVDGARRDLIVEPRWSMLLSPVLVGVGVAVGGVGVRGVPERA